MSATPPQSSRPSRPSGGPRRSHNNGNGASAGRQQDAALVTPISDLFPEALEGGLALVRADSGELALLDASHQMMVVRARRSASSRRTTMGMSAPSSQPLAYGRPSATSQPLYGEDDDVGEQSTVLLPAATRTYRCQPGEGIIGQAWQRGEPVVQSGEDYRIYAGQHAPGSEAAWHLAVPIFKPGKLTALRPGTEVIGVLAVHRRDPARRYEQHDVEALQLHADRVARALTGAELDRLEYIQSRLFELLQGPEGAVPQFQLIWARIRELARGSVDAPSFALALYNPYRQEVIFEGAERDNRPVQAPAPIPTSAMPPWWRSIQRGEVLRVALAEDPNLPREFGLLGWGNDHPVQSLLAAPLGVGQNLLGAVVVGNSRPDVYGPEHVRLFEAIAHNGSIVLEHARLSEEMRRSLSQNRERARQLAALNNSVLTLNASLDLKATLTALVGQSSLLTTAQSCVVFLMDEAEGQLVARGGKFGTAESAIELQDIKVPLGWRHIGRLLQGGQFVVLEDLTDEWDEPTGMGPLLKEQQIVSCLVVPIMHQAQAQHGVMNVQPDKLLGALVVYTPGQRLAFPPEQVGLLQGLASQAGMAINNAQVYRELEQLYEEQKELDRLKDEFILTISHEFRTPLTTIDGYVTLITRHAAKLDPDRLAQYGGEIRQASSQLAAMISMLADANRMGLLELTLTSVNVRAAADRALSTQSADAKARITFDIEPDLWVRADEERLPLVFSNLIGNAIKYSPDDTPIRVTAHRVTAEQLAQLGHPRKPDAEHPTGNWVVMGVRDQGIGISPEDQAKLFKKFVRLSHSLTTSVRGTGLGLWICKSYVDAMGGEIWVESVVKQGSLFQFCLPAAEPPAQQQ